MADGWRKRLKHYIDLSGMTPREVTRRAKVNPTMIHDVLVREQTPSIENLAKVCKVLNVSLSELYDGETRVQFTLRVTGVSIGGGMWGQVPAKHSRVVPLSICQR